MSLVRAFIAVELPAPLQQAVAQHTQPLRQALGSRWVRWVAAPNLHLTVKFLGEVSPAQIDLVTQALRAEADRVPAFDLTIAGLGSFPNSRRPRVLWAGIQAPAGLEALYRGLETACVRLGFEAEPQAFHPHLTLGRVRPEIPAAEQQKVRLALAAAQVDSPGGARVDSVHLYQSDLKPSGAIYTKLFSAPLHSSDRIHSI